MATVEQLTSAVDQLVEASTAESHSPRPNLAALKDTALKVLYEKSNAIPEPEATDETWRRPKPARDLSDDGVVRRPKLIVKCPSNHPANRFITTHSGYTCDVCRKGQPHGTTMYGCRMCNWDACVPCHGKKLHQLKAEAASAAPASDPANQAAQTPAADDITLPQGTLKAVMVGFDLFNKDPEACTMLLQTARVLGYEEVNRTRPLRSSVELVLNEHIQDATVARIACSTLQKLYTNATDIVPAEADAVCHTLVTLLSQHSSDSPTLEAVLGVAMTLHDASPVARGVLLQANMIPLLKSCLETKTNSTVLIERACGLFARLAPKKDREANLQLMKKIMSEYGSDEGVREQVFTAGIAFTGTSDPDVLVKTIEALAKMRVD